MTSRRDFLKSGGVLIVGFSSVAALADDLGFAQGPFGTQDQRVARQLDSWLAIGTDGRVTAYTGKCELGQGIYTVQMQLVAEELSVPLSRVTLIQCDTSVAPDQGTTSGSQSTPTNFNERNLAQAAATARQALLTLASRRLNVPVDQLEAANGFVALTSDRGRRVGYGDLIAGRKLNVPMDRAAKRKTPAEWTVLGTPAPRLDMAAMATGQFEFVHNVRVPGMLHGAVVRPPSVGAALVSVDEGSVRGMPGVVKVVVRKNFVGVVAEKPWQAMQAAGALKAVWAPAPPLPWSPTQSAYPTRSGVAALLGLRPDDVRVVFTRGSGCYGINGADTVSFDAAILSQAAVRPVRVQLSRKDEMAWENYGFAYVIDQRVGVDVNGTIAAWDYEAWYPSRGGRPGYDRPGNVITGMLAGYDPQPFRPSAASEPTGEFRNGANAAPSYVAGRVGRRAGGAGTVASERVLTHTIASPFFTGPLRSPSRLQNTFAHECLLDEVAAHVRADPVAYRLRHLRNPRLEAVVSAAAKAAGWDARPSPRPGIARTGVATGRGVACVLYEGDNGYVAMVAEVAVDWASGRVTAKRLVVAQDCGPISNPDGMRNQLEGGALQGLSRALGEEVTWDDRAVTSIDWLSYHSLPLGFEMPAIETVLIDTRAGEAMGAGETAITVVAAAVGNAIFDATGLRLREVPFTPDRVKRTLEGTTQAERTMRPSKPSGKLVVWGGMAQMSLNGMRTLLPVIAALN